MPSFIALLLLILLAVVMRSGTHGSDSSWVFQWLLAVLYFTSAKIVLVHMQTRLRRAGSGTLLAELLLVPIATTFLLYRYIGENLGWHIILLLVCIFIVAADPLRTIKKYFCGFERMRDGTILKPLVSGNETEASEYIFPIVLLLALFARLYF